MLLSAVAANHSPFLLVPSWRTLGKPWNRHTSGTYARSQSPKGAFLQDGHRSTMYLALKACKGSVVLQKPPKASRRRAAVFQDDWQEVSSLQAVAKDQGIIRCQAQFCGCHPLTALLWCWVCGWGASGAQHWCGMGNSSSRHSFQTALTDPVSWGWMHRIYGKGEKEKKRINRA